MRIIFLGDVVGRSGRDAVVSRLGGLRDRLGADVVAANVENAAAGYGITEAIFRELCDAGVDVMTLGNHAWDRRECLTFIEREDRLLRPINYPSGAPGRGANVFSFGTRRLLVVNAMGRLFMNPMDDPFRAVGEALDACPLGDGCDASLVDMHAEATSEKQAMGCFVDGRASVVVGTHTHVPTSDYRVLEGGSGYVTDVGMCGCYDSVIGMSSSESVRRFETRIPYGRMEVAEGEATLCGVLATLGDDGKALRVEPIRDGGSLSPRLPELRSEGL